MDTAGATQKLSDYARSDLSDLLHAIAKTGDPAAVERLYRISHRSLYTIAYSICRDPELSEDIFQETMLYIWQHADTYRYDRNPTAWIYVITRHIAIDTVRRRKGWEPLDETIAPPEAAVPAEDADARMSIWMGIGRLGVLEAQVFVLRDMIGLPLGDVAEILERSYRSVHYRHRNALRSLREYLSEEGKGGAAHE